MIAEYGDATTYFVQTDQIRSTRLMTAMDQSVHDSLDYTPFGEQIAGDTGTTHKFTGYERDSESNLDNAQARYYSSQMGRFMSPDPYNAAADPSNPQSWNMYSYVINNPLSLTDATGLDYHVCSYSTANGTGATDYSWTCGDTTDTYAELEQEDGLNAVTLDGTPDSGYLDMEGYGHVGTYSYFCDPGTDAFRCGLSSSPEASGGSTSGDGGGSLQLPSLKTLIKKAATLECSSIPDAFTAGGGGDFGLVFALGGQVGVAVNGRSGELSVFATGAFSFGLVSPDVYGFAGIVPNAPNNAVMKSQGTFAAALGVSRFGVNLSKNNYQATVGPSLLPATVAIQHTSTAVSKSIPYVGYVINPYPAACHAITGS